MEAYDNAMRVFNQGRNDQVTQAALQGLNLDIGAQPGRINQALARGQFGNEAALSGLLFRFGPGRGTVNDWQTGIYT